MKDIGIRIKEIRRNHDLKQFDFAQILGIHRAHISKVETGRANPSEQLIKLICEKFKYNEEWIKTGRGIRQSDLMLSLKRTVNQHNAEYDNLMYLKGMIKSAGNIIQQQFTSIKKECGEGNCMDFLIEDYGCSPKDEKLISMLKDIQVLKDNMLDFLDLADEIEQKIEQLSAVKIEQLPDNP